jgi:putative addiction module component (TIGR02574 family)
MLTEKDIISAALNLPLESRAVIIDHILESLMRSEREEIDALWAEEAEHRIGAYERGEIVSVPGEQVFQNIQKMLEEDNL